MPSALLYDLQGKKVWVAGHRGMVGAAVVRRLAAVPNCQVLTVDRTRVDLRQQEAVHSWMQQNRPQVVVLAAAKVGGIYANATAPADFLTDNLAIATHVIQGAHAVGVEKLVFLGSSCIYPREAPQPLREEALLTGPLEPTNQWYAIAKIAGLMMCQAYQQQYGARFISVMPTNLYGPGDTYDLARSHVLPALIHKLHRAVREGQQTMEIWGTGTPRREFLFVDDLADAIIFVLQHYEGSVPLNVGVGEDMTITQAAEAIAKMVGFQGRFHYQTDKPDGTPRKVLDVSRLRDLGWTAKTDFTTGLRLAYADYCQRFDPV